MPSLRRSLAASLAAATALQVASADSMTTVAVLEMGKGGVTRRTSSPSDAEATVAGVSSLWNSLHDTGRRATSASSGMSVVSDLFSKPDGGIAIGITGGVDLASMPAVSSLLEGGSVSTVRLAGSRGEALLDEAGASDVAKKNDVGRALSEKVDAVLSSKGNNLEAVRIGVDQDTAASADAHLSRVLKGLHKEATEAGRTVVVHLVVEEEEGAARRRQLERNLDEEGEQEEEGEEEGGEEAEDGDGDEDKEEEEDANGEDQDANQDADGDGDVQDDNAAGANNYNYNNNGQYQSGYYGYGYYDDNNEWVQVSKTIFQIQYNNVVLWTAIGLVVVLWWTTHLMVNMPLMADTLLFGESAKMMGD